MAGKIHQLWFLYSIRLVRAVSFRKVQPRQKLLTVHFCFASFSGSGFLPAARKLTTLLSKSNQNGAPNDNAPRKGACGSWFGGFGLALHQGEERVHERRG